MAEAIDCANDYVTANNTAKVWCRFTDTGTAAVADSFNVDSISDDGTGDYSITFTTALADANYCGVGLNHGATSGIDVFLENFLAGSIDIQTGSFHSNATNANVDVGAPGASILIFGDE